MPFFTDIFLESINRDEFYDSVVRIYLMDRNNKIIEEKEFLTHRLILSYHSNYFMDEFMKSEEQSIKVSDITEPRKKKHGSAKSIKHKKRKELWLLNIEFTISQKKLFQNFHVLFNYLYGKPYHPDDVFIILSNF